MKRLIAAMLTGLSCSSFAFGRDFGVMVLPIHQGKLTSSLLYEYLKVTDDFDTRGNADFKTQAVGAQFSYGISDTVAVAVKGGSLINPEVNAQGSQWQSRAGYLYGVDVYNEVFPATPGLRPGLQLSLGASGYQVPLDRLMSSNGTTLIDQKLSGVEYHGSLIATFKVANLEPYTGLRGFGSSTRWRDNQPMNGSPASIAGHAHGNISVIVGLPVQISKDVRLHFEGVFFSETMITAGFQIASF